MPSDLERPLGKNLDRKPAARWTPARGAVALSAALIAVAGIAGALSFQQSSFRTPEPAVVVSELQPSPEIVSAVPQEPLLAPAAEPEADIALPPVESGANETQTAGLGGAKIIKVPRPQTPENGPILVRNPGSIPFDPRTAHLPDQALLEESPRGPLPKRSEDGRRPMDAYARGWSGARGARLAIVIGGLGVSQTGTQKAIQALPPEITLAFASQGNSLGRWKNEARRAGHELLMQLPMEPFDFPAVNPGPDTLLADVSFEANRDSLHSVLGRTTNYTGVVNYLGARFTSEPAALGPVMQELAQRGLLYLDDGTSARSRAEEVARASGTPYAAADTVIDADRDRGAILRKLDELERTARAKGYAIGTGSAFDTTVEAVASWANEAKLRGIEIVPVSALVTDPER